MGRHVHLIGIGGSGLSAIATLLWERGEAVSGSDRQDSPVIQRLKSAGMRIFIGHRAENIAGADLIVRSSAVQDENVEVQAGRQAGIPVLRREEFLPQLSAGKQTVAVAGTHGKTTTTALIAWLLSEMSLDPSFIIGGFSTNLDRNAHAGDGELFIIEADEYDRMFLGLDPWIAVVTNVEHDHPDCYPTPADFQQAFEAFTDRIADRGCLLACADDAGASALVARNLALGRKSFRYSLKDEQAEYFARDLASNSSGGYTFDLYLRGVLSLQGVRLKVPGVHNVSNALAALAVIDLLGLPLEDAGRHCGKFRGTSRRFEIRSESDLIAIVDDYAHHPSEIRATLAAARGRYPGRRIWAVWLPHTYSRTQTLLEDYQGAFMDADRVLVTEIYAAREQPTPGFSGEQVAASLAKNRTNGSPSIYFEPKLESAADLLLAALEPGDVVLVLSAGDADWISSHLLEKLDLSIPSGGGR